MPGDWQEKQTAGISRWWIWHPSYHGILSNKRSLNLLLKHVRKSAVSKWAVWGQVAVSHNTKGYFAAGCRGRRIMQLQNPWMRGVGIFWRFIAYFCGATELWCAKHARYHRRQSRIILRYTYDGQRQVPLAISRTFQLWLFQMTGLWLSCTSTRLNTGAPAASFVVGTCKRCGNVTQFISILLPWKHICTQPWIMAYQQGMGKALLTLWK